MLIFCPSNLKLLNFSFQFFLDFNFMKLSTVVVSTLLIFVQFFDEVKFAFNPLAKVPLVSIAPKISFKYDAKRCFDHVFRGSKKMTLLREGVKQNLSYMKGQKVMLHLCVTCRLENLDGFSMGFIHLLIADKTWRI